MGSYREKVTYFKSYQQLYYRLIFINNKLKGVQAIKYSEQDGDFSERGINDYLDEKNAIEKELRGIEDAINGIEDINMRYVLAYKFLQFKTLEEIAEIMHYSLPGIKKIYKNAINSIPKYT